MHQSNNKHNLKSAIGNNQSQRLIRIKKVIELTGISKSYVYALSEKGLFPKSVQLVPGGSSVGWVESEILEWIDSRIHARNLEINSND